MRITALTLSYVHVRRIGAELALHALLTELASRGHKVSVRTMEDVKPATVDGVDVEHYTGIRTTGDLVITNSGLATRTRQIYSTAPLLVWAHNNQRRAVDDIETAHAMGRVALLSNSNHMADVYLSVLGIRSQVLHPPVTLGRPQPPGDALTMVNLTKDKGSGIFWHLAAANPEMAFLAVRGGYGRQDIRDAANVTVVDHGDLEPVWTHTRTLLLPSVHESYSMTAVEAASRGIPTLARDLPGVREALGKGAVYVATDAAWADGLTTLTAKWATYRRAAITHSDVVDTPSELVAAADYAEWTATL